MNITSTIPDESSIIGDTSIRCDGSHACYNAQGIIKAKAKANGAGNIYVGGLYGGALEEAVGATGAIPRIEIGDGRVDLFDIFCTGENSCRYQYLQNADNLYCMGHESCKYAQMIHNVNNVYSYAYDSAYEAVIDCGPRGSCYSTSISNVLDTVYGSGYQVLKHSNISNVTNHVIGMGYQTLFGAVITNVTNVC